MVVAAAEPVWAGSYAIVLTPERDTALAWAMKERSARSNPTLPLIAPQDFLQNQANDIADRFISDMGKATAGEFSEKWAVLDKGKKDTVCTIINLKECGTIPAILGK
jgi:hypothetical protein